MKLFGDGERYLIHDKVWAARKKILVVITIIAAILAAMSI